MLNVRLAGGHLYGKQLFTWLSLVVSLMASFVIFMKIFINANYAPDTSFPSLLCLGWVS